MATIPDHEPDGPRLHRWNTRPVFGLALLVAAVGFAQFSPAAILADVADHFGERTGDGGSVADTAGLSGTVLGVGLAVVRLASLAALVLAAVADRRGRRTVALWWAALGLTTTVAAAASPGYWVLVAALALARPLLTATNTIAQVLAAELTSRTDRAGALALLAASYGVGTGAVVLARAAAPGLGFRGVLALVLIPLAVVVVASRWIVESDRFLAGRATRVAPPPWVALEPELRARRRALAVLTFAAAMVTGPANTLLFVYAESVLGASTTLTAALVLSGGPTGLVGLLLGRWGADHLGRRPTAAAGLVLLAGGAALAYSGSLTALVVGFPLAVLFGSVFSTPALALGNELFPTSVRASVAGWLVASGVLGATGGLVAVGLVADATERFAPAVGVVCLLAAVAAAATLRLPETKGVELERTADEPGQR